MIYEMKRYTAVSGKFEKLTSRFAADTVPAFERTGINLVNAWTAPDEEGVFYYMTCFDSDENRVAAWKAFAEDERWRKAKAASEVDGPLLAAQSTTILKQAPFITREK